MKRTYRVRAFKTLTNGATEYSPGTNKASAVTNLPGPDEVSATNVTATSLTLNWRDNASNEDGFEIWMQTGGSGDFVRIADRTEIPGDTAGSSGETISYNVAGLAPYTSYAFRVRAVTTAFDSMFSATFGGPALRTSFATAPVLLAPQLREERADFVDVLGAVDFTDPDMPPSRFEWEYSGQRLVYRFNQPTNVDRDDLILTRLKGEPIATGDVTETATTASDTETFTFGTIAGAYANNTLPNGNYEAILRAGGPSDVSNTKTLAEDNVTPFFVFAGDINHDRVVDSGDYAIIDANSASLLAGAYAQGNLNYSVPPQGSTPINSEDYAIIDYAILNTAFGTRLPEPLTSPNTISAFASREITGLERPFITLGWEPPQNVDIDGYKVFRSVDGGVNFSLYQTLTDPEQESWTDWGTNEEGLAEGTKYTYRLRAFSTELGMSGTTNRSHR